MRRTSFNPCLLVLVALLAAAAPAWAATFTVVTDGDAGDGFCDATCTLRDAILEANGAAGVDIIDFAMNPPGLHVIQPSSALPDIVGNVTIDGTTQPGFPGTPIILLDGSVSGGNGLQFAAGSAGSTVLALAIGNFVHGIDITDTGITVDRCHLGTNGPGDTAIPNTTGIFVNAASAVIGTSSNGNLVSGNSVTGILLSAAASNTVVHTNRVGTDAAATSALPNAVGIGVDGTPSASIGGAGPDANIVSGNTTAGISVTGAVTGTQIRGNLVGLDVNGNFSVPNGTGIVVNSSGVTIGGGTAGDGNVIGGNTGDGILVQSGDNSSIDGNVIGMDIAWGPLANGGHGIAILAGTGHSIGGAALRLNAVGPSGLAGIYIAAPAAAVAVVGNYVGLDPSGTVARPNTTAGIQIDNSTGNYLASNYVSGNASNGIQLNGAHNTTIVRNNVGIDAAGGIIANTGVGIMVFDSNNVVVGGQPLDANVVSGNDQSGIQIDGTSTNTRVESNMIGVDAFGTIPLGNTQFGILVSGGSGALIGGLGRGNVISGNFFAGVYLDTAATTTSLLGNSIGTDVIGTTATPNGYGVGIAGGSNEIGAAGAGNLISGNYGDGIYLLGAAATNNNIFANVIGLDSGSSAPLGNTAYGIHIDGAPSNVIGSATPGTGNLIGTNGDGILVSGAGATGNVIKSNVIGTDALRLVPLGNITAGIVLEGGASGTVIGGLDGTGNVIHYNVEKGILVGTGGATATDIDGNDIYGNGYGGGIVIVAGSGIRMRQNVMAENLGLGIDLELDGVTLNDAGDADTGANGLTNFPVILTADESGGIVDVTGTLSATPSTSYDIEFFLSPAADLSGFGEGAVYASTLNVTTDAAGNVSFAHSFAGQLDLGDSVTATATGPQGTSELSEAFGDDAAAGFEPPDDYGCGDQPSAVTSGDFDNDGVPDVVVANRGSSTVTVLRGNGDGTFGFVATVPTGTGPLAVDAGDADLDGNRDLVTANEDGSVSLARGNGDGTFGLRTDTPAGTAPADVRLVDLDADGALDLIVVDSTNAVAKVSRGNGDGTFLVPVDYPTGTDPRRIAVHDLDRDGISDLVVLNYGSLDATVRRGNGDGTFGLGTSTPVGTDPRDLVLADFDRDGSLDMAVTNGSGGGAAGMRLKRGNGDGTFLVGFDETHGVEPGALVSVDIDGDGAVELIAASATDPVLSVRRGNGDGTFGLVAETQIGEIAAAITAADLDGSGRNDVAAAAPATDLVSVLLDQPGLFGDYNGDENITAVDLVMLANLLVGNVEAGVSPFTASADAADLNQDGAISATDLVLHANFLVGNICCLPL